MKCDQAFSMAANGRALATGATDGMVKWWQMRRRTVFRRAGDCPGASELIASAVAHMEYGGSAEDLARTIHAHPTLSESSRKPP